MEMIGFIQVYEISGFVQLYSKAFTQEHPVAATAAKRKLMFSSAFEDKYVSK